MEDKITKKDIKIIAKVLAPTFSFGLFIMGVLVVIYFNTMGFFS